MWLSILTAALPRARARRLNAACRLASRRNGDAGYGTRRPTELIARAKNVVVLYQLAEPDDAGIVVSVRLPDAARSITDKTIRIDACQYI